MLIFEGPTPAIPDGLPATKFDFAVAVLLLSLLAGYAISEAAGAIVERWKR